jgi:hypothetical protein
VAPAGVIAADSHLDRRHRKALQHDSSITLRSSKTRQGARLKSVAAGAGIWLPSVRAAQRVIRMPDVAVGP